MTEEAIIDIQVLDNPFNPWFTPSLRFDDYLFYPAKTGADESTSVNAMKNPYQLEVLSKLALLQKYKGEISEHIEESREELRTLSTQGAQLRRYLARSSKARPVVRKKPISPAIESVILKDREVMRKHLLKGAPLP